MITAPAPLWGRSDEREYDEFLRQVRAAINSDTGGGGSLTALYLTLAPLDATLTAARLFTPGTGLSAVDAGAGAAYTLNLADTAVTPGPYTYAGFTVDAQGRLTAAASGAAPALGATTITAGAGLTGGGDLSSSRTIDVGAGAGITVGVDSISANLSTGYGGGQTAYGGVNAAGYLWLASTQHATKGLIYIGQGGLSAYDDVNERLGLGTTAPSYRLHLKSTTNALDAKGLGLAENTSAGNTAGAGFIARNDGGKDFYHIALSSGYAGTGALQASAGILYWTGAGPLGIVAANAAGVINFYTGGDSSAEHAAQLKATGVLQLRRNNGLELGIVSSVTGGVKFFNASSAFFTSLKAGNALADVSYTLPTDAPAVDDYVLSSKTTGVTSWVPVTAAAGGDDTINWPMATDESHPYTTYRVVGQRGFTTAEVASYPTVDFQCCGYVTTTTGSFTGTAQLYDLTAASSVTTFSFTSVSPVQQTTTVALSNNHFYEVRIYTSAFLNYQSQFVLMNALLKGNT